jgi:MscS family membrane protein
MLADLVQDTYFGNSILNYAEALGIVLASILVGKVVYFFTNMYLKKLTAKTETRLDDLLIDAIEEPLVVFIFAGGLYVAIQTLAMPPGALAAAMGIVTTVFVMAVAWLIIRFIDIAVQEYLLPLSKKSETNLDDQLIPLFSKGLKAIVAVVGILVVLSNFGVDITALIAGLGIGGLAFALASKDTVENMFGAFAILLDKPFMVGDRITVDGVTGDVLEVGLRSTRLQSLDNTEIYIPNSKVVMSRIENVSRPDPALVITATLSIVYQTPSAKLEEGIGIVKTILSQSEGVHQKYAPTVIFKEFSQSSLDIMVKYWIDDYKEKWTIIDRVNRGIKERFEKSGIEFAYPTQTVILSK